MMTLFSDQISVLLKILLDIIEKSAIYSVRLRVTTIKRVVKGLLAPLVCLEGWYS
jgi:hypothetical protein